MKTHWIKIKQHKRRGTFLVSHLCMGIHTSNYIPHKCLLEKDLPKSIGCNWQPSQSCNMQHHPNHWLATHAGNFDAKSVLVTLHSERSYQTKFNPKLPKWLQKQHVWLTKASYASNCSWKKKCSFRMFSQNNARFKKRCIKTPCGTSFSVPKGSPGIYKYLQTSINHGHQKS